MVDKSIQSALETAQLPSLPELVSDLRRLIDRDEDIKVIADLLATDASLVVRVIELANSAFYGHHNITRISEAVQLIGLKRIDLFVRTAYTIDMLKALKNIDIDMNLFWVRSFISALASQKIAEHVRYPKPESMYTAGLMMNIGELIAALLPAGFDRSKLPPYRLAAAQMHLWGFPSLLVAAIRYYPEPSAAPDQCALPASILHIADYIVQEKRNRIDDDVLRMTRLDLKAIEEINKEFEQMDLPI